MLGLHQGLLTNGVLIFFLYMFLNIYDHPDAFKEVFSACFALALASILDLNHALFLLLVWIGFLLYRVFSWREWLSLLGLCL